MNTIAAISTAQVEGAISIVRLSGDESISIVESIFQSRKPLSSYASNTINYGHIVDGKEMIDEVLVSLFRAPQTYTTEDVVEINCHGGVEVTNQILLLLLKKGARLAEPGEFTKRAFLGGRIDLTQAEAVSDIIASQNKQATSLAVETLSGKLSSQITDFRSQIVDILAAIEVNIDYPEYDDVEQMSAEVLHPKITSLLGEMDKLLRTANTGKVIRNGVKTVIVGKPNVGKSSLLNTLLQEQKAIVTDIAGTTRDIVEGDIRIGDLTLHMIDTAGIHHTEDVVEKIGIQKSREMIEEAELVLLLLDASRKLEQIDRELLSLIDGKKSIVLLNKVDLPAKIEMIDAIVEKNPLSISALHDQGIDDLYDQLLDQLDVDFNKVNAIYLSNLRHIDLLEKAKQSLVDAQSSSELGMPIDMITIDLQDGYANLGEILGIHAKDDLLDTLFSQFCLGK